MIADLIRDIAIVVFIIVVVAAAWYARTHPGYIRSSRAPARPQLMPALEPLALPSRMPVAWQVPMYEELQSISPHLSLEVHRLLLLILEKHAGEWADELVRELTAARRVVKGELAS